MTVPETEKLATVANPEDPTPSWSAIYARRLAVTDVVVIIWAVIGSQILWFGSFDSTLNVSKYRGGFALSYSVVSVVFIIAWALALAVFATRDSRVVGTGSTEFRRVVDATFKLFGVVAIVAFLFKLDLARGFIITALPVGLLALLASRWLWRQWLSVQRANGLYVSRVLLVGSFATVATIARELARQPLAGYMVVGACVPDGRSLSTLPGTRIPVVADVNDITGWMAEWSADTVVVTGSDDLPPERIRELSWALEPGRQHLVLAPSLTDIGGPRIHTRPVAGLPLIHVETPRYEGARAFAKRAFDVAASAALILALSPILVGLAVLVKMSSPGPALYRSIRVGHQGRHFAMLKFRSMRDGANAELAALLAQQGTSDKPLFKIHNDPRVTPIGNVLRRFSLDELPQLFNVFLGSMSLVGPRPQVEAEVALYNDAAHRRLLLKPGVSGLWQVSGRSNLSWEDAIRLDLYYVENWSITGDLIILWRTAKAVLARDGAV